MSEFVFPSAPATGATTTNPNNNSVYLWDGNKWVAVPGGTRTTIDANEPLDPRAGDFWYDLTDQELKLFDGIQWIVAGAAGGGRAVIDENEPAVREAGDLWWEPVDAKLYLWDGEQWVIVINTAGPAGPRGSTGADGPIGPPGPPGPIPIAFSFPGQPPADTRLMVSIATPLVLGLGDSTAYSAEAATAATTFAINKISGGTTTPIGTVVFSGNNAVGTFTGMGGVLETSDVLEVVAPAPDATLADVAITILAYRIETGGVGGDGLTVAQAQAVQAMINTAMAGFSPNTTGSGNTFVLQQGPTINQPRVVGVTDGSAAAPGEVGEYLSDYATGIVLDGSYQTLFTLNLTAGDWDVSSTTIIEVQSIPTNNTDWRVTIGMADEPGVGAPGSAWPAEVDWRAHWQARKSAMGMAPGLWVGAYYQADTGPGRVSLAATTPVYLKSALWSNGQYRVVGANLRARRVR